MFLLIYADNALITSVLGWKPKYNLGDALLHAWEMGKTDSATHELNIPLIKTMVYITKKPVAIPANI